MVEEALAMGESAVELCALETLCDGLVDFDVVESVAFVAVEATGAVWAAGAAAVAGVLAAAGAVAGPAGVALDLTSLDVPGAGVGVAAKEVAQAVKTIRVANNLFILRPFCCLKAPRLGVSIQRP